MDMKRPIITTIAILMHFVTWANNISKDTALNIATEFLNARNPEANEPYVIGNDIFCATGNTFYVFNAEDQRGFVIVAGDDRAPSILAYSLEGYLNFNDPTCSVKSIFENYATQIQLLRHNSKALVDQQYEPIPMLIKSTWGQNEPYNNRCDLFGQKSPTGCVATAMAQVLYYHHSNSINKITATIPGYTCRTTWTLQDGEEKKLKTETIPEGTTIDWTQMKGHYTKDDCDNAACDAVACLMRYCGIATETEYRQSESIASLASTLVAMRKYFGYSQDVKMLKASAFTPQEWQMSINRELTNSRPIIMSGEMCETGHVFICDGIDEEGRLHINWGLDGQDNGYFMLKPFVQDERNTSIKFYEKLNAIMGLHPANNEEPFVETIRLTTVGLSIGGIIQKKFVKAKQPLKFKRNSYKDNIPFCYEVYQQNMTASTHDFESALGIFDKKGKLIRTVEHTEDIFPSFNKTLININSYLTVFGASIKKGVYQLWPISRQKGSKEWILNEDLTDGNYIQADVKKKEITISIAKRVKKKEKKKKK
jgi:hypothetical protein